MQCLQFESIIWWLDQSLEQLKQKDSQNLPRDGYIYIEQLVENLLYFSFNFTRVLAFLYLNRCKSLSQILVIKLMSGRGEWQIFDWNLLKAVNICFWSLYFLHFPKNITNHIFHIPKWFIFTFPEKKAFKRLFWTYFHIFPSEPISYTTISIKKLFIKWFNNTEKQSLSSLFVSGKSAAPCVTHIQATKETQYFLYRQFPTDQKLS